MDPPYRCHFCRDEVFLDPEAPKPNKHKKLRCERCEELYRSPPCRFCGLPVRGLARGDPDPYHNECRRCSSCYQVIAKRDMRTLAGRLLCKSCSNLFGQFFVPSRRPEVEHMKETFTAWDHDGSGYIEKGELKRVLKALDPDFADRDIDKLIRTIDTNGNGFVDFSEFCDWITKGDPFGVTDDDNFEELVTRLMRDSGKAVCDWKLDIAEVHVRYEGLYFVTRSEEQRLEADAIRLEGRDDIELVVLDPEEFITKVEKTESACIITLNTGRVTSIPSLGPVCGPFVAPQGFQIIGMRTKPAGEGECERVVGVDLAPLAMAQSFDSASALRSCAEKELLYTLRELLSKAAVDVNSMAPGGVSALMLAAQNGSVGSMRLLLQSKAKPSLCDEDGWTALTFASRYGQTAAVDLLLEKHASQEGDGGVALAEALRKQHNSAARALLRAGLGVSPRGTFALEDYVGPEACALEKPKIIPASGNYSQPVVVNVGHPNEGVRLFYSLDGRDPFTTGRRYRGPLTLRDDRNHLRVVAVKGDDRSVVAEAVYRVCYYALPDEIVVGKLRIRTFPEAKQKVFEVFARLCDVPYERMKVDVTPTATSSGKVWLRARVSERKPRHRLVIDRSYTLVTNRQKKKDYLTKFSADVRRATGEEPTDIDVSRGSIILDFSLGRAEAAEMARQLEDPNSYLLKRAKLKLSFGDARFQSVASLGDRTSDPALHGTLHAKLGVKAQVDEVTGLGFGDEGVIVMCTPETQVKKLRVQLDKQMKSIFPEAIHAQIEQCSEELEFGYTIDVVNGQQEDYDWIDGGTVVKCLNNENFAQMMTFTLGQMGLSAEVESRGKASAKTLSRLEFHLQWDFPQHRTRTGERVQDFLDGICLLYQEDDLAQTIDFRSAIGDQDIYAGADTRQARNLRRAINRAIRHSGDIMSETGGEHHMSLDLAALPDEITDLYFVLAAFESEDLSLFQNPTVEIHDADSMRQLTEYTIASAGKSKAVIMCSLSRTESRKWIVRGLGIPTTGNVRDYEPIKRTVTELQGGYERWERRRDLVKLRVMHKLDRMTRSSTSQFALMLSSVLELPVPVFQLLVTWL